MYGKVVLLIALVLGVGAAVAAAPRPHQPHQDPVAALAICDAPSCAGRPTCVSIPVVRRDGSLDIQSACRSARW
jgi:hypothetical protein